MRRATMSAISPDPSSSRTTSHRSFLISVIARYWIDSGSFSFFWDSTLMFVADQSSVISSFVSKGGLSQVGLMSRSSSTVRSPSRTNSRPCSLSHSLSGCSDRGRTTLTSSPSVQ